MVSASLVESFDEPLHSFAAVGELGEVAKDELLELSLVHHSLPRRIHEPEGIDGVEVFVLADEGHLVVLNVLLNLR